MNSLLIWISFLKSGSQMVFSGSRWLDGHLPSIDHDREKRTTWAAQQLDKGRVYKLLTSPISVIAAIRT